MSRDWKIDKAFLNSTVSGWGRLGIKTVVLDIAVHYHQQYAAEKERADRLHKAIEKAVSQSWGVSMLELLDIKKELTASLYPKEETKP